MPENDMSQFSYYGATDNGYWKNLGFQFTSGDEPGGLYWSKTERIDSTPRAWHVYLNNGDDYSDNQNGGNNRAVCSVWND